MPAPTFPTDGYRRVVFTSAEQTLGTADRFAYRMGTATWPGRVAAPLIAGITPAVIFDTIVEDAKFKRTGKTAEIPDGAGGTLSREHHDLGWECSFTIYLRKDAQLPEKGDPITIRLPNASQGTSGALAGHQDIVFGVDDFDWAGAAEGYEKFNATLSSKDSIASPVSYRTTAAGEVTSSVEGADIT